MSCLKNLDIDIKNMCKKISSFENVYKCCNNSYIVKLFDNSIENNLIIDKELSIYNKILNTSYSDYFCSKPLLFKDEYGQALIYETSNEIYTLYYLYFDDLNENMECKSKKYEIIKNVVLMLEELNKNGIYHGDAHEGNIIYNCSTNKIQFVDVESVKILPFDNKHPKLKSCIQSDIEMIQYYKDKSEK